MIFQMSNAYFIILIIEGRIGLLNLEFSLIHQNQINLIPSLKSYINSFRKKKIQQVNKKKSTKKYKTFCNNAL